jgi:predicted small secreted protein
VNEAMCELEKNQYIPQYEYNKFKDINMKIKLKIAVISFALIGALFLSGCHTAQGFGEDVEIGGQAIQNAATN